MAMQFIIDGADQKTGQERTLILMADSAEQAIADANRAGYLVASCRAVDTTPQSPTSGSIPLAPKATKPQPLPWRAGKGLRPLSKFPRLSKVVLGLAVMAGIVAWAVSSVDWGTSPTDSPTPASKLPPPTIPNLPAEIPAPAPTQPDEVTSPHFVKVGVRDGVYYAGSATEDDAALLGEIFKEAGIFNEQGADAVISKGDGETVVSVYVKDNAPVDGMMIGDFRKLLKDNASKIGGLPIRLKFMTSANLIRGDVEIAIPTMDGLLDTTTHVGRFLEQFFDYSSASTACWRTVIGEPDAETPYLGGGENWTYTCSDGELVFHISVMNEPSVPLMSGRFTILTVERKPTHGKSRNLFWPEVLVRQKRGLPVLPPQTGLGADLESVSCNLSTEFLRTGWQERDTPKHDLRTMTREDTNLKDGRVQCSWGLDSRGKSCHLTDAALVFVLAGQAPESAVSSAEAYVIQRNDTTASYFQKLWMAATGPATTLDDEITDCVSFVVHDVMGSDATSILEAIDKNPASGQLVVGTNVVRWSLDQNAVSGSEEFSITAEPTAPRQN